MVKKIKRIVSLFLILALCLTVIQLPTVEVEAYDSLPNNIYFGHLHNHSNMSDRPYRNPFTGQTVYVPDAVGTPEENYDYARYVSGLDFLGLTDHDAGFRGSDGQQKWQSLKNAANAKNADGEFVTFWGFEWTDTWDLTSGGWGHVSVLGTDDFCDSGASDTDTFPQLVNWMNQRNGIGFFNHPGDHDDHPLDINDDQEFCHFNIPPTDKIVGMELWNKFTGMSKYFDNDGYEYEDGNKNFFDEALTKGWYLGASGSEDNHDGNPGIRPRRLAIIADELTRDSLWDSLKRRRFYSTEDTNLELRVTIGPSSDNQTNMMGDKVNPGLKYLQYEAKDTGGSDGFVKISIIKRSKNGSMNAFHINLDTPLTRVLGENIIDLRAGEYFYIIAQQADGDRAVSSPIFANFAPESPGGNMAIRVKTALDDKADTDEVVHAHLYAVQNGKTMYEYETSLMAPGINSLEKGALDSFNVQGPDCIRLVHGDMSMYNQIGFSIPKREGEWKVEAASIEYSNKVLYADRLDAWVRPANNYIYKRSVGSLDPNAEGKVGFVKVTAKTADTLYAPTEDSVYFGVELANGSKKSYRLMTINNESDFDRNVTRTFYTVFNENRSDVRKLYIHKQGIDGWRPSYIDTYCMTGYSNSQRKVIDVAIDEGAPFYNLYKWDRLLY